MQYVSGDMCPACGRVLRSLKFTCARRCVCYGCAMCAAHGADVVSSLSASVLALAVRSDGRGYVRKAFFAMKQHVSVLACVHSCGGAM